jgi:TatD DNase family protein
MLIDSHCHLDYPALYTQLDEVLNRAKSNKIKYLLTISTNLNSFEKIKTIVNMYENVYGTLGIHPHEAKNFTDINSKLLKNLAQENKKIIGIGETGLDYYYNHSEKDLQKRVFIEHIKTASDLNIPLIVHTRNAENDTFEILKSEKKNLKIKVLIHCFTGTKEFAKKLLNLDCHISFSGIITFKKTEELSEVVNLVPLNKILIETDSPYLAPTPYRGKPNEPSYLAHVCNKVASIKKLPVEDIMNNTSSNFLKLFNLN